MPPTFAPTRCQSADQCTTIEQPEREDTPEFEKCPVAPFDALWRFAHLNGDHDLLFLTDDLANRMAVDPAPAGNVVQRAGIGTQNPNHIAWA